MKNLLGICSLGAATAFCSVAPLAAQTFQELYSFTGGADGLTPAGALIQGRDGNFYGTTTQSGPNGCGTVFRISPGGNFTTVAAFTRSNGCYPYGALLEASDGNFYGTTLFGGIGRGNMFRMTPGGGLTSIGIFNGGAYPLGDLIQGPDGLLYGMSQEYGDYNSHGTLFSVSTNGWGSDEMFINIHLFYGYDGLYPSGGLLLATDGNFYGVTAGGGADGYGTIFRLKTNGEFVVVTSFFQGPGNAVWPVGKLLQASDGNFYGASGGGVGTIFKCTTDAVLTTFDRFMGYDGEDPVGGLVQANDGYIYGSAYKYGGSYPNNGCVFRLALGAACADHTWQLCGNLGLLFELGASAHPEVGHTLGKDGNLYGTTAFGGAYGAGSIFRIIMPGNECALTIHSITASPAALWPPNHKMQPVKLRVSASDNCGPVHSQIISVTSSEGSAADWEITGDLALKLRAERSGKSPARVYTVTVECADDSGNKATGVTHVTVPH